MRVVHTRHEQGAAYMALGAALATGRPQAYSVVPGPGLLNSGAALLTAYGMNAPVLAMIGQIPASTIGKRQGHLHEIRDQAGILARLVDHYGHIEGPADASSKVAKAIQSMSRGRPGPAALECAMDVWGKRGPVAAIARPLRRAPPKIDDDASSRGCENSRHRRSASLIVAGGGAQDASPEVTLLSEMLQAPVLGYRRGRGVLDRRNPFSVTLPLGRELWGEADVVLAVGTRLLNPMRQWGVDKKLQIVRVDADPDEPARLHKPKVALVGDAAPILRRLIDSLAKFNTRRASRADEMRQRQAKLQRAAGQARARNSPSSRRSAPSCRRTASMSMKSRRSDLPRGSPCPSTARARSCRPGYQDNLGWGYATALGVQHARPDVPVLSINGDGGFLYTGNEIATAIRHRIPLVGGGVRRRGIRQCAPHPAGAIRQSADCLRPCQSRFREIRGELRCRRTARPRSG